MPKKKKMNVIFHYSDDPARDIAVINEKLSSLYVDLVRQKLLNSGLTSEEMCAVLDMLINDWKDKEGAFAYGTGAKREGVCPGTA